MSLGDGGPSLSTFDSVTLLCPTQFHYSVHVLCCQTLRGQLTGVAFIIQCSTTGFITRSESIHQSWIKTLDFSRLPKKVMTVNTEMYFKFFWSTMQSLHADLLFLLLTMMERFYWVLFLCKCFLWMTRYFLSFPLFEWGHWTPWHFDLWDDEQRKAVLQLINELRKNCCGRTGQKKSKTLQEVLADLRKRKSAVSLNSVKGKCEHSKTSFATTTFGKVFCNKKWSLSS